MIELVVGGSEAQYDRMCVVDQQTTDQGLQNCVAWLCFGIMMMTGAYSKVADGIIPLP